MNLKALIITAQSIDKLFIIEENIIPSTKYYGESSTWLPKRSNSAEESASTVS